MLHKIIGGTPLVYSLRIKGPIDQNEFQKAVRILVDSNPILQFTFRLPAAASSFSEFTTGKPDPQALPIDWEDLVGQNREDQDARILNEFNQKLNMVTSFDSSPLFSFKLFKILPNEVCLMMSIAHVICDGLGSLQLLNQLLSHLSNLTQGSHCTPICYNNIVKEVSNYHPSKDCLNAFDEITSRLKKGSFEWNPNNKTVNIYAQMFKNIRLRCDRKTTKSLVKAVENLRVSLFSIIVTAYIDYFFSTTSAEKIILTLPTSGKIYPHVDAQDLVGCFAQAVSVEFERRILQQPIQMAIKEAHEVIHLCIRSEIDLIQTQKIARSIKSDFRLINGHLSDFTKAIFRNSIKSNVYISYTGHSPLHRNYGDLEIIDYQEGTFNNSGVSDWMHTIFDEELYLFANYDSLFFEKQSIEAAMQHIKAKLCEIAEESDTSIHNTNAKPPFEDSDNSIYEYLLNACSLIGLKHIDKSVTHQDLEAQLGLDSLSRIRLIAKVSKDHNKKLSRNDLFMCRTLDEFANVIRAANP
jgi:acyl carrier protein